MEFLCDCGEGPEVRKTFTLILLALIHQSNRIENDSLRPNVIRSGRKSVWMIKTLTYERVQARPSLNNCLFAVNRPTPEISADPKNFRSVKLQI